MNADLTGQTLGGRYDVLGLVGTGGMGTVYRARDRELDEVVALKVIRPELAQDADAVERFRHEVKLARRVTHPNIARTYELGSAEGLLYCTLELIEGESLTHRLARGALALTESIAILSVLCDALTAAHAADVIHRDVKPDNVLVTPTGRVVIADFGIAALGVDHGESSGTPAYMAPEQARGAPPTPAADIYSLGLLLFEMLVGRPAFSGSLLEVLDAKQALEHVELPAMTSIPDGVSDVIARATARDPLLRFSSASSLRSALAPWSRAHQLSTVVPRPSTPQLGLLTTVVVLPPVAASAQPRMYLAEAVRELVLAKLARAPGLRVLRRSEVGTPLDVAIRFTVSDRLRVEVSHGSNSALSLELGIEVDRLEETADTVAHMVRSAIALDRPRSIERTAVDALDHRLAGHHLLYSDVARLDQAYERLASAWRLAPGDPRTAADLAVAQIRRAFFVVDGDDAALLDDAERLAQHALERAPELANAHLANGLLELNTGDAATAAGHFRVAISAAPQAAEAHDQLGRMLLEAGYLSQGRARLEEALAIAPSARQPRWDLERMRVLEGEWEGHRERLAALVQSPANYLVAQARFAWWRDDITALRGLRVHANDAKLLPEVIGLVIDVIGAGSWGTAREPLLAHARDDRPRNRRRKAFVAQLIAEAAARVHDDATTIAMLERADALGLFDLHWLDRCPSFARARLDPAFIAIRARVRRRAEAILDALYGDHGVTMFDTAPA